MTTETNEIDTAAQQANDASVELMAKAEAFSIATPEQFQASGDLLREIKTRQKAVAATRTGITKPMDAAKKRVMDIFKPVAVRLVAAEQTIKGAMLTFTQAEDARRREEQAARDEVARKERERLERRAADARTGGHDEKADVLEQNAARSIAPQAEEPTKAEGVHTVTTWHAEVVDLEALIKSVAAGETGVIFLQADMTMLNESARTLKGAFTVPGVRAVAEESVSARAN